MEDVRLFTSEEFGNVRTVVVDKELKFVGKDIAEALGYAQPTKAIRTHCKGVSEMDIPSKGGVQRTKIISESDVYRLIVHSKMPKAEEFEEWIFEEVLPTIRKTGRYVASEDLFINTYLPFADEQTKLLFSTTLKTINEQNQLIKQQKETIEIQKEEIDYKQDVINGFDR